MNAFKKLTTPLLLAALLLLSACGAAGTAATPAPDTMLVFSSRRLYPLGPAGTVEGAARLEDSLLVFGSGDGEPRLALLQYAVA